MLKSLIVIGNHVLKSTCRLSISSSLDEPLNHNHSNISICHSIIASYLFRLRLRLRQRAMLALSRSQKTNSGMIVDIVKKLQHLNSKQEETAMDQI